VTEAPEPAGESLADRAVRGAESSDPEFARYVFDDARLESYTQLPPTTVSEMFALLDSLKQRLIVPTGRVEEFETAVRSAGLDDRMAVVGHPWLEPDQVLLMQSEAEFEADQQAMLEAGRAEMLEKLRELARADMERLREDLEAEARQEREREYLRAVYSMQRPFHGLLGIGDVSE